ncbi:MAG: tetratricopeptide repeat protein, partial [Chloroflexota bacterium]
VLEPAAETYEAAGDMPGLARVTAAVGWTRSMLGASPADTVRITALLERLEQENASPSPPLAALYLALGRLLFIAGHYDASLQASERAAALARAQGDDRNLALAEENRVNLLQMLGRLGDALRVGQEMLPLAEQVGNLDGLWGIHNDLAYIHVLRADFARARRSFDLALTLAEQTGNATWVLFTLAVRSWIAVLAGDWPSAHADLDRAASLSRQADPSWYSTYLPTFQGRLSLAEGEWQAAAVSAQEAIGLSERSGDLQALRWAATLMAEIEIREGRPNAARDRLIPLLDRPGLAECDVTMFLPILAWAYLELDQADLAAETAKQAIARARPEDMRLVLVEALWVRVMVALRQERWEEAARSLDEGIALARAIPYP